MERKGERDVRRKGENKRLMGGGDEESEEFPISQSHSYALTSAENEILVYRIFFRVNAGLLVGIQSKRTS